MQTVAIVGVGLIGASFGLALKKAGFAGAIVGVSSEPAIEAAVRVGAIDASASLSIASAQADLIYLSQTVDRILETIPLLNEGVRPGALVTDAGSTKTAITAKAAQFLPNAAFVGGHPMAGKEVRGADAADADLFAGRPYILMAPQGPATPHLGEFHGYLERMGARVLVMTAEAHDEATAFTSHLPQLLSTALANMLRQRGNAEFEKIHGLGLLDMTRLALSSPDLWKPILESNQANVVTALDAYIGELAAVRAAVQSNNIEPAFQGGELFARRLRSHREGPKN